MSIPDISKINPYTQFSKNDLDIAYKRHETRRLELHEMMRELREVTELKIAPFLIHPISVTKSLLNPNKIDPINYYPHDIIEIRAEIVQSRPVWIMKNRSLSERESRREATIQGTIEAGTLDDVRQFIDSANAAQIGLHKIEPILREMPLSQDKHLLVYKLSDGKTIGLAYFSDTAQRAIRLDILATDPQYQRHGVGTLLLERLQQSFDYIHVNINPFDMQATDRLRAREELHSFYMRRGFSFGDWEIRRFSLEDINKAQNWTIVDPGKIYNIAIGHQIVGTSSFIEQLFVLIESAETLNQQLPEVAIQIVSKWKTKHSQLEAELNKVRKEIELISNALTLSSS